MSPCDLPGVSVADFHRLEIEEACQKKAVSDREIIVIQVTWSRKTFCRWLG